MATGEVGERKRARWQRRLGNLQKKQERITDRVTKRFAGKSAMRLCPNCWIVRNQMAYISVIVHAQDNKVCPLKILAENTLRQAETSDPNEELTPDGLNGGIKLPRSNAIRNKFMNILSSCRVNDIDRYVFSGTQEGVTRKLKILYPICEQQQESDAVEKAVRSTSRKISDLRYRIQATDPVALAAEQQAEQEKQERIDKLAAMRETRLEQFQQDLLIEHH